MLIRKNTKTFKTILEIITACQDKPDREKFIRLYITKAGHSIKDRINVEGIQGDAAFFYELNYHAVLSNLQSSDRQLNQSDDIPGIYFFHSTSNKVWDETPFEFDEVIKKEFASLPDLPVVRKKEKAEKVVLHSPKVKSEPKASKKEKVEPKKIKKIVDKGPKQPDYKLKHKVEFTDLDKVMFRQPQLTKKDVLDYYNKSAEYLLPYLRDRPQIIRLHSSRKHDDAHLTYDALEEDGTEQIPKWVQTKKLSKENEPLLFCNDKDHLLFYVQMGGIEFRPSNSRSKSSNNPDYIVIGIDTDVEFAKVAEVALSAKEILNGLQLPSFVKTDGKSGLHIYIPLDAKGKFETGKAVAEYICKLIRIKIPNLVNLDGTDDHTYGKVTLNYLLNEEGKNVTAPYSLVGGDSPTVAAPLRWEEVKESLQLEDLNHETIFKRLKQVGDPFETLFKKKVNADTLLERMEANYSFLF